MLTGLDTSYRYTTKKFALLVVMVVSPNQQGHRVAYAIINRESEIAHNIVLGLVKKGVEDVVNSRLERGDKYV
jgi:hypothetical protein